MGRVPAARVAAVLSAVLLLLSATVAAEQSDATDTFKVDVKLVRILATFKDSSGQPVAGLTREDVSVSDNGAPQQVTLFETYTEQPLSVAILLDISGSTAKDMKTQTDAVARFVKALFGEGNPEDRASLYTFNWQVSQEVRWTRNASRFGDRMRHLKGEAGTAMYDAMFLAAPALEERKGRHVIVVVTDGGDTVSTTSFHKALEAVHSADAVIYPILTVPITNNAGRNIGGENALTTFAQTTGGKVSVPGLGGLDQAFSEILRDLRTQYLIGYYPRNVPLTKNRFHRLEIKSKRSDLRAVARTGYYGDAEPSSDPTSR